MSTRWDTSAAKYVIQTDLMSGVLDTDFPTPQEAWGDVYSRVAEIQVITYEKFVNNLRLERDRHANNINRSAMEEVHMHRDRRFNPRSQSNARGELVMDLHPGKLELREDVIAGRHLGMTPEGFQLTRPNYQLFDLDIFAKRIYQEEKLQKYFNYRNQNSQYCGIIRPDNQNQDDNSDSDEGNGI
jgi:hypothetical protein